MGKNSVVTLVLPPGRYFVGDPCYVIPDNLWSDFCDITFESQTYTIEEFRGHLMLAGSTAYGDGRYADNNGQTYGVDSGMLGIVPEALWLNAPEREIAGYGQIVEFGTMFPASCNNGVFSFGPIFIDTQHDDEEDENDDEDE